MLVYGWSGLPRMELEVRPLGDTLAGQWLAAVLFCRALPAERVPLRVDFTVALRAQLAVLGRDLLVRTMAFQACFVLAAAVVVPWCRCGAPITRAGKLEFPCRAGFAWRSRRTNWSAPRWRGSVGTRATGSVAGDGVLRTGGRDTGHGVRRRDRRCCPRCSPTDRLGARRYRRAVGGSRIAQPLRGGHRLRRWTACCSAAMIVYAQCHALQRAARSRVGHRRLTLAFGWGLLGIWSG